MKSKNTTKQAAKQPTRLLAVRPETRQRIIELAKKDRRTIVETLAMCVEAYEAQQGFKVA